MSGLLFRFRLVHGVTAAAVCLLALKGIGLLVATTAPEAGRGELSQGARPDFARVLSHARSEPALADPLTTGSVDRKPSGQEPSADSPAAAAAPPLVPASTTERTILDRLGERRDVLQQRGREIDAREKLIQEQERKLEERFGQMKAAEDAQKGAAVMKASGQTPELKGLVVMYETMKPKEAARVFDRLPLDILLSVATQMNARKMSEILAVMSPEGAEKLTVALARRGRGSEERVSTAGAALPPGELQAIEPAPARREPGLSPR